MEFSSITSLLSCEQKQMNNFFKNFALKICVGIVIIIIIGREEWKSIGGNLE